MAVGQITVGLTRRQRWPQSIIVNGVTYFLLRDDATGAVLFDDATNQPLYG